jgi:hypothetical protein
MTGLFEVNQILAGTRGVSSLDLLAFGISDKDASGRPGRIEPIYA